MRENDGRRAQAESAGPDMVDWLANEFCDPNESETTEAIPDSESAAKLSSQILETEDFSDIVDLFATFQNCKSKKNMKNRSIKEVSGKETANCELVRKRKRKASPRLQKKKLILPSQTIQSSENS